MTLRDRIYLRFFLFHRRYGRMWAALLEGLCLFVSAVVVGLFIFSLFNLAMYVYGSAVEQHTKAARQEAATYQNMLLACLNGGVIGKAGDEVIACDPAVTFKFGRVR